MAIPAQAPPPTIEQGPPADWCWTCDTPLTTLPGDVIGRCPWHDPWPSVDTFVPALFAALNITGG